MENKTAEEMNRVWKDWSMGVITLKEAVDQEFDFRTKIIQQQLAEKDKEIERLKEEKNDCLSLLKRSIYFIEKTELGYDSVLKKQIIDKLTNR